MAQFKDPFLRDLENLSDSESESDPEQILSRALQKEAFKKGLDDLSDSEREEDISWQENEEPAPKAVDLVDQKFSKLKSDTDFNTLLNQLSENQTTSRDKVFQLINQINEYLRMLGPEIMAIHKTARDGFIQRFPELESIILVPGDYCKAVLAIGNDQQVDNLAKKLSWLSNTHIMSVTVAFSASQGALLSKKDYAEVERACLEVLYLEEKRNLMLQFLERHMHTIAPNTMALVGATTCAKLISSAGSLIELSRTPAGNIQVLGSQKKALHGLSSAAAQLHRGHLGEVGMVKNAPQGDQIKIIRMLASKTALTARIDVCGTHPKGDEGERMREQIIERYAKISAPGQSKLAKILPKPDDKPRKKRGGAKYRNMKLKYAMTMHRKLENTMAFGVDAQQEHAETGKTFGLKGMAGGLKMISKDQKILKKKPQVPSFGQQTMLGGGNTFGQSAQAQGLVSTVAMTAVQGMELINPDLISKQLEEAKRDNYFNSKSGFTTVLNDRMIRRN